MKNIIQKYKMLFGCAIKRDSNPTALLTGSIIALGASWVGAVGASLLGHATNMVGLFDMISIPFVALFCVLAIAYPILTIMNLKNAENNESWWCNLTVAVIWGGLIAVSIFLAVSGITA